MIDEHDVREMLHRRASAVPIIVVDAPRAARRARRRLLVNGAVGVLAAAAIALATFAGVGAIRSAPVPADRPTPSPGVLRANGEVLSFTGDTLSEAPGDLVAVNPETGEERVLVEDLDLVLNARWSADGRWVAYDLPPASGGGLWVLNAEREPRQLMVGGPLYGNWTWSPTDPQLAIINGSTLTVLDASTGDQTDLGDVVGDVTSAPVWSPDGKQILFGARGGSLYSVDVRSGERSVFVRLPGEDLDSMDEIAWSPDGAHLAVLNDLEPGGWRLYVTRAGGNDVRVLVDDVESGGIAWSPDGTRLAYAVPAGRRQTQIWTVSADGSAPILVETSDVRGCGGVDICNPVWSPDGAEIAFKTGVGVFVIDADGLGEARRIDELTYLSWRGGRYFCGCYG